MSDFFEEIKAVHWPLAFLTYLLRNLQLVVGCVGVLKIGGGNAGFFLKN